MERWRHRRELCGGSNKPGSLSARKEAGRAGEYEPENVDLDLAIKDYAYFLVRGSLEGKATRLGQYADRIAVNNSWELWRRR